ncbi:50S ribosomal protein L21 [Metamycoplasma arthritidis]|uniref:Large ribosomal subunit protein bL21 n=1 Tax=Metamycoplasma arthritidis (strain 158L3-1) TaxID=243272 RepID=RL21_META1|nr:50S ribosomal protein L21 [Metamycoplasma arthritidis]B3PMF7.1 RecName: Full=Large ribosomal subunit protein bL21; AltName: Full=50S ribosomal protein L21 [Metamycoplasma arthritidis 158L3-1]ACF07209.1 ribosomal protein L21 [Metamycoplasma arthritidis 158L3-1]VEU78733.1 50S ribosomal protein L21 [Metamycoplasma arthritidis]
MFAIIETGGKQIIVKAGDTIFIEKIEGKEGDKVSFDKVLAINDKIGTPYLENAAVLAAIEKQGKAKKIVVYRHNAKSTHKRKLGHRQPYTRVKILEIKEAK